MDPKQTLSRRHAVVSIAALPLLACGGGSGPRSVRAEDFTLLATDFVGGVQFIDGNVRVAINASGQVAFVATELPPPGIIRILTSGSFQGVSKRSKKAMI